MHLKEALTELKQWPPATQVVLILVAMALLVLLAVDPTASTSILAFLVAFKALTSR